MIFLTRPSALRRPHRAAKLSMAVSAALLLCLVPAQAQAARPAPPNAAEQGVSDYLDAIRDQPEALRTFFSELPKGGDLHNHLSGAASTELLLQLASQDGLCIQDTTMRAVPPPCQSGTRPASDAESDRGFRQQIIRAWSMQDFVPGPAESGHDHFFATFDKFGEATWRHPGRLLSEVVDKAAAQHQFYLETMLSPASAGVNALVSKVGWDSDLPRLRDKLLADGAMDQLVAQARSDADKTMAEYRAASHCDTARPDPGCSVPIRFISQASRAAAPAKVFTQLVLGMELAQRDPRFVAVNLVQPEDAPASLENYDLEMRMLDYLHGVYPGAHITLHAGELVPGLVKPEDLSFHIREAISTGHAERIGHGVDVGWEKAPESLLRTMADRHIMVEVPLTSNAQILQVSGNEHPFPRYRAHHVPVALATDDEGVSRTDITAEYQRAATTYHLDYSALKDLARTSLEYAFLPGRSLWKSRDGFRTVPECAKDRPGTAHPGAACTRVLKSSPKATVEWRQEGAFAAFEYRVLHGSL